MNKISKRTYTAPMPAQTIAFSCLAATPLSPIWIAVSESGLVAIGFEDSEEDFKANLQRRFGLGTAIIPTNSEMPQLLNAAVEQVQAYLQGSLRGFTLPIDWSKMGKFQAEALQLTLAIPYGEVTTYAEIARKMGQPRAARAVGRAEATNPMPLVIPCHRVVGSDGALHGYGGRGGLLTKAWLLKMEKTNKIP
jgi:methylated-DNA-[protein]-cysteine S-methyltransferase